MEIIRKSKEVLKDKISFKYGFFFNCKNKICELDLTKIYITFTFKSTVFKLSFWKENKKKLAVAQVRVHSAMFAMFQIENIT